jgi:hypothetical protein
LTWLESGNPAQSGKLLAEKPGAASSDNDRLAGKTLRLNPSPEQQRTPAAKPSGFILDSVARGGFAHQPFEGDAEVFDELKTGTASERSQHRYVRSDSACLNDELVELNRR